MHDGPLVRKSPRWIAIWSCATLNSLILETCFWEMWRGLMPSFSCWRSWGTCAIRNESDLLQSCDHVNSSFHDYLLGLYLGLLFLSAQQHCPWVSHGCCHHRWIGNVLLWNSALTGFCFILTLAWPFWTVSFFEGAPLCALCTGCFLRT